MLHYFPPVVAGVLVPGLVVMALIVIPYFKVNIEAEGVFLKNRVPAAADLLCGRSRTVPFPLVFKVYAALVPTLIMAGIMLLAASEFSTTHFSASPGDIWRKRPSFLLGDDMVLCSNWWCLPPSSLFSAARAGPGSGRGRVHRQG